MAGITKQEAHLLAGNEFKLQDKEGNVYDIICCWNDCFFLEDSENEVHQEPYYSQIGTDYHIICHSLDKLTQPIMHEGKEIVPIVELAKIEGFFVNNLEYDLSYNEDRNIISVSQRYFRLSYSKSHNSYGLWADCSCTIVENQPALFAYMDSLHFDRFGWAERGLTVDKSN